MRVEFGAHVISGDGHDIGTVERLIVDHATGRLNAVAVHVTLAPRRMVEVPLDALKAGDDTALALDVPVDQIGAFETYDEERYTSADDELAEELGAPADFVMIPSQGGVMYLDTLAQTSVADIEASRQLALWAAQQEEQNAVVGERTPVRSSDGQRVGTLHGVDVTDDGQARRVTIHGEHGHLPGGALTLPITAVAGVDDDAVTLKVSAAWLAAWASLGPGQEVWSDDDQRVGTIVERQPDALLVLTDDRERTIRVPLGAVRGADPSRATLTVSRSRALLWTGGATSPPA